MRLNEQMVKDENRRGGREKLTRVDDQDEGADDLYLETGSRHLGLFGFIIYLFHYYTLKIETIYGTS